MNNEICCGDVMQSRENKSQENQKKRYTFRAEKCFCVISGIDNLIICRYLHLQPNSNIQECIIIILASLLNRQFYLQISKKSFFLLR